jgi:predicted TIM-barrel fold metal-dependent hydrolase
MYSRYPDKVYPFFAGIPLREETGITMAVTNLEKGYLGIGEIVAASTSSPMTSRLPWKAEHPNDGILPELYQLSARYGVPVLLHIDPPGGKPIEKLEQALKENPQAIIIFGHANAYNTPANIERLVGQYPHLYIDFFAGFTAYNPDSTNELADYVPLIEKYPNQFMVGTDSGYGISQEKAIEAIYELLDLLSPEAVCQVSHQNMERIIESQLPTETQIAQIEALSREAGKQGTQRLNKRMANELIFELKEE